MAQEYFVQPFYHFKKIMHPVVPFQKFIEAGEGLKGLGNLALSPAKLAQSGTECRAVLSERIGTRMWEEHVRIFDDLCLVDIIITVILTIVLE